MTIVAAMGLGLALTTSLEPQAAANYESGRSARLAAEAGVAVAVREPAGVTDWNLALTGLVHSAVLEQGDTTVDLPTGRVQGSRSRRHGPTAVALAPARRAIAPRSPPPGHGARTTPSGGSLDTAGWTNWSPMGRACRRPSWWSGCRMIRPRWMETR